MEGKDAEGSVRESRGGESQTPRAKILATALGLSFVFRISHDMRNENRKLSYRRERALR